MVKLISLLAIFFSTIYSEAAYINTVTIQNTPLPVIVSGPISVSGAISGTVSVNNFPTTISVPVNPTGAATSDNQIISNNLLGSIDSKLNSPVIVSGSIGVNNFPAIQTISMPSLPANGSTASKQDIGNESLSSIDSKLTNPLPISGSVTASISNFPATISVPIAPAGVALDSTVSNLHYAQGAATSGKTGNLAYMATTTNRPSNPDSTVSPLSGTTGGALRSSISQIGNADVSSGNGTAGTGSLRVVIASDNSPVPVSFPSNPTVAATQSGTWTIQPGNTANTTPWLATISQGGNPAVISNASPNNTDYGLVVRNISQEKVTYRASSIPGLSIAVAGTDFFTVTGSASKIVQVHSVGLKCTQTAAADNDIVFLKRSTPNTGGTSTTRAAVSMDSLSPSATATIRTYTANPTTGTLVGNISVVQVLFPVPGGGASSQPNPSSNIYSFGDGDSQPITLRGTSEVFSLNFNGQTAAGNNCDIWVEWTEE